MQIKQCNLLEFFKFFVFSNETCNYVLNIQGNKNSNILNSMQCIFIMSIFNSIFHLKLVTHPRNISIKHWTLFFSSEQGGLLLKAFNNTVGCLLRKKLRICQPYFLILIHKIKRNQELDKANVGEKAGSGFVILKFVSTKRETSNCFGRKEIKSTYQSGDTHQLEDY